VADYGHDLLFGSFITPQNDQPEATVALAQVSERAGLDLVTFQDHPYQPRFLDTWTLLSWVAARTERIHVATNVMNLPLRQPAVIARSVASLDLLSGGRVDLGLGAGGFWDAIEAMGGRRLTPGQAVDALSEAIDIIRAIWDTSTRRGVVLDGEYYKLKGAKRGPEPAHDIPIWLGAYKPRMLRLTGEKADGWLPSLPYLDQKGVPDANARIDEAAEAAGRSPREIRRLLNIDGAFASRRAGFLQGPPEQWVEQLLPLVLEQGFSAFILSVDDPRTIERFGAEVAPALREAVDRERKDAGTPTGPARGPAALAQRKRGIDYDSVPAELAADAVEPGDRAYRAVRSTYMYRGSPGLVLRPRDAGEVAAALGYAREQDVPLAIRSGGHGISGRSTNDGGIVIDLGHLDSVEVLDAESGRVRVGPGARWGSVARALAPHGLAMSSGDFGDVGVGGLATTGGIGFLARKHGLTIDHVAAAEIVLADGRRVRADAGENPDLYWAVRGAGANFGIVTAFELDAYELGDVVFSTMIFDASDAAGLLEAWGAAVEAAPRELTSSLNLSDGGGTPVAQIYNVYTSDDAEGAVAALSPLLEIGPVLDQRAQLVPYPAILPLQGARHVGQPYHRVSAGLAEHITPELAGELEAGVRDGSLYWLQVRSVGGAVNDVDPLATAYAHRTQNFSLNGVAGGRGFEERWAAAREHMRGLYLSFESEFSPGLLEEAFPGETLARLRELKGAYDPENVFNQNFPIEPTRAPSLAGG